MSIITNLYQSLTVEVQNSWGKSSPKLYWKCNTLSSLHYGFYICDTTLIELSSYGFTLWSILLLLRCSILLLIQCSTPPHIQYSFFYSIQYISSYTIYFNTYYRKLDTTSKTISYNSSYIQSKQYTSSQKVWYTNFKTI